MSLNLTKNERGLSMVELMAAVGLLSIVVITTTTFNVYNSQQKALQRVSASKDSVVATLRRYASNPTALRNSVRAEGPPRKLSKCVQSSTPPCDAAARATPGSGPGVPFDLMGLDPSLTTKVAGGSTPVYYNDQGTACSGAIDSCPVRASSAFWIVCSISSVSSCNSGPNAPQPDSIMVKLTIDRKTGASWATSPVESMSVTDYVDTANICVLAGGTPLCSSL